MGACGFRAAISPSVRRICTAPDRRRIGIEHERGFTRQHVPGALDGFLFQLPGRPAGVPEIHPEAVGIGPDAISPSRGSRVATRYTSRRRCGGRPRPVLSSRGAARPSWWSPRALRHRSARPPDTSLQLRESACQRHLGLAVDDHAHGAFVAVVGQKNHRLGEVPVRHVTRRDQQLARRPAPARCRARAAPTGVSRCRAPRRPQRAQRDRRRE